MNVYERLNEARQAFHATQIKKTGHNKFAGYDYFELADFIVPALRIFKEFGLVGVVAYGKDEATLTIINIGQPDDRIVITSPMSEANLKGCHPVQNLGAVQTYLRRYLWVAALEIVEHDGLNATQGKGDAPRHSPVPDVQLSPDREAYVKATCNDMIDAYTEGNELAAIQTWYAPETWADNEERIFAWSILKPHSKLRSLLTKNKPANKPQE